MSLVDLALGRAVNARALELGFDRAAIGPARRFFEARAGSAAGS